MSLPDFSGVTSAIERTATISKEMERLSESVADASRSLSLRTEEQVRVLTSVASTLPVLRPPTTWVNMDAYAARLLADVSEGVRKHLSGQIRSLFDSRGLIGSQVIQVGQQLRTVLSAAAKQALEEVVKIDWEAVRVRLAAHFPDDQKVLRVALADAGLLPAPTMPEELGDRVVWLHRSGSGSSQIANAVSGMYSRGDWRLLDDVHVDWPGSRILLPHKETMDQASIAMRQGLYRVVAPALVPLVEGIAADYLSSHEGRLVKVKHSQIATKLEEAIPLWAANSVGLGAVMAFLEFLEEKLFGFVDFDKDAPKVKQMSVLNRHVILHGRSPKQATRMNGLRSFLLLDVLGAVVLVTEQR